MLMCVAKEDRHGRGQSQANSNVASQRQSHSETSLEQASPEVAGSIELEDRPDNDGIPLAAGSQTAMNNSPPDLFSAIFAYKRVETTFGEAPSASTRWIEKMATMDRRQIGEEIKSSKKYLRWVFPLLLPLYAAPVIMAIILNGYIF